MGLAAEWEGEVVIRNRARKDGRLTAWPSVKTTGVASMKACSLNKELLLHTASWWVQFCEQPASIPVDLLRAEAWLESNNTILDLEISIA